MGIIERKEREKEHRREDIIAAAQKIFFEKGLPSATMDEIAEAAELSKGTLYLYYKSKEDL
ncbi:MAG: helix-turn-helix domain-containing protein, partial [bacterium]